MKERDIRPADLFERYLELSQQDAERFFKDPSVFEDVPCLACEEKRVRPAFWKAGFQYVECTRCETLYVSPRPTAKAFRVLYEESPSSRYWAEVFFPAVADARRDRIFVPRVEQIRELCAARSVEPAVVVEVGAGYGVFLEEFRKRFPGSVMRAVEPGRALAEVCRGKGFETLEAFVEDKETNRWADTADVVVSFETIEHVHSPKLFVEAIGRLLRPGGLALVTGLGVEGFDIQVLWERSKSVYPPHHINFMSIQGFELLFQRAGFENVEVFTPGKLDVDIVKNEWQTDSSGLEENRFARLLVLRRDDTTHERFQEFLAENNLSSHVWVLAQRPAADGA